MEHLDKDRLFLIAIELDLPAVLNFCKTNKNINEKVCNNKLKKDYNFIFTDYLKFEDPKRAYQIIYNTNPYRAAKLGSRQLFEFVLKKSQVLPAHYNSATKNFIYSQALKKGMKGAIESENLSLIKYFVEDMKEKIEISHLKKAIELGNAKILQYLKLRG